MKAKLIEKKYLLTFILVTSLFALWGFANDITNPMVAAFQTLMELTAAKASMVQFAFYGGYATMAIPAALFIRRYSYKSGILLGLGLYAVGAFLFIPAAANESFAFFCVSLYILTFGLAFLETTANPFILSLGAKETSTRRLNLAQAFNPMGSLCGMSVASLIVLPQLISDRRDAAGQIIFGALSEAEKADIRVHDLAVIRNPYVAIGLVVVAVFIIIALTKMPKTQSEEQKAQGHTHTTSQTLSNLWHNTIYREGVLAQMFYVAAQINLDFHHPVCRQLGHQQGHGPDVQHRGDVALPLQPLHLDIPDEVRQLAPPARYLRLWCRRLLVGRHLLRGHVRTLLSGRHQLLHVADGPHHLRHRP